MSQKLIVGPINKGLNTAPLAFYIDNDAFPDLVNAYQWRGRIKRKRGTTFLCRLQRYFDSTNYSYTGMNGFTTLTFPAPVSYVITLSGGAGNLFGPYTSSAGDSFSLETVGNVVPGSVTIENGGNTYNDLAMNGTLAGLPAGSGTINYGTGAITIVGGGSSTATVQMTYFPDLPVMGIEDFSVANTAFPLTIAFDTVYSYNIPGSNPAGVYDVSFYKNPLTPVTKVNNTPVRWNGNNYQQFFTINYEGALWATNGIPYISGSGLFDSSKVGVPLLAITSVHVLSPTRIQVTFPSAHGLVVGDYLFFNEVVTTTGLNFMTGYVDTVVTAMQVDVTFQTGNIVNDGTGGIAVYLTNVPPGFKQDCIRWYDGDPTSGTIPITNSGLGWVNFCPPLSFGSYSIAELPANHYYLAGAKMIWPYKDRLLMIGPVIQTAGGTKYYLQDTVIFSQNGTPYYTSTYLGDPTLTSTTFTSILTPSSSVTTTATASAWWEDFVGYGGFKSAAIQQPISSVANNEDVLILGFSNRQARLVYTSNDIDPFEIYSVNSEFGSTATFSAITVDRGIYTIGRQGLVLTSQHGSQRVDLQIPDTIFELNLQNNGTERITAQRDFINEWIYFSCSSNANYNVFNNQTIFYNYRDNSWGIFYESFTTYGSFRASTGLSWSQIPWTWMSWNEPWNSGAVTVLQPHVVGGTTQGYILIRNEGSTTESVSMYIDMINLVSGLYVFTSYNHQLNNDDYITISGVINDTSPGVLNGQIFQVINVNSNTFTLNPNPNLSGFTYVGGGQITRMYIPVIQTKQFPVAWEIARKVRLGWQEYLLTITPNAQITLLIFLSQNADSPYNGGPIVPALNSTNNSLIYSTVLFTSPENYIQNVNSISLGNVGDGSSLSYTFSYAMLFKLTMPANSIVPGSVFISVGNPVVATFKDNGNGGFTVTGTASSGTISYSIGNVNLVFSSAPSSQPTTTNFNYFVNNIQSSTASAQDQVWHRLNTSLLGDTVQLGFTLSDIQMTDTTFSNQFAEIELHGFVINVSPSQLLA